MNKISHAIDIFYYLEEKAHEENKINSLHPLSKLLVTLIYMICIISFPKYALFPLLTFSIYLMLTFTFAQISFCHCIQQIKWLLVLVGIIGLFNPLFDRTVLLDFGLFYMTTGIVSMLTLFVKGCFTITASYLLICTTSMEEICYALHCLHIPDTLTTSLLLSYRHLLLLLSELKQMTEAYSLRSVNQKGIHIKSWGSFIGYFLLRSMDRADSVAESMLLRGYHGSLLITSSTPSSTPFTNIAYVFIWSLLLLFLRFMFPFIL